MTDTNEDVPVVRLSKHRSKFLGLQVLRILAAVMVVCLHATFYIRERMDSTESLWAAGRAGVDIFFVLSGFVMIYTSEGLAENKDGWKIFVRRRLARVVPLYWIALTIKLLILIVKPDAALHTHLGTWQVISSYLFLPSYNSDHLIEPLVGVGWTLNFEMFFYALFTLALFTRINIYRFIGSILFVLSLGEAFRRPTWPAGAFYLDSIVLEFFLGMLVVRAVLKGRGPQSRFGMFYLAAGIILLWVNAHGPERIPSLLRYGIPAVLLVWGTVAIENHLTRIPRGLLYLAEASYAIYLWHPMLVPLVPAVMKRLGLSYDGLALVLGVLLALLCGTLIHKLVESPINNVIRRRLTLKGSVIVAQTQ